MRRLIAVALLAVLPAAALAQPLADRVPDDAILYVGWSGTSGLGPAYQESHLKAVVDASNIGQLITEFVPNAIAKISEKEGEGPPPEVVKLASSIGKRIWQRPTAFVFGGVDMSDPKNPMPRVALLVDAGGDADAMLNEINTALAQVPRGPGMPTATKNGNIVAISTLEYAAAVKQPLAASPKFRDRSRAGLYGDAVEELDWAVGEVIKAVRDSGKEKDTLVIFTSDNGPWINLPERMLQAGNLPWHVGSAGALRSAKGSTYEGGVRVPTALHWPGHFEGGRASAEITATMDLYATLVRLGTGAPAKHAIDGHDLTDFLAGKTNESPRKEFFYFNAKQLDGVRSGSWKLRLNTGIELFNLDLDPSERYNREKDHPEIVAELKKRLEQMLAETNAPHKWQ